MQKIVLSGIFLFCCSSVGAVSLSTTDWSCSLSDSTITNAGDYYGSTLEPGSTTGLSCNSSSLSISSVATSSTAWTLEVGLQNSVSGVTVQVRRTGTGSGDSVPSGGSSYITLSTAKRTFFTGTGDVSSIPLAFRISDFGVEDGRAWDGANRIEIEYEVTTSP